MMEASNFWQKNIEFFSDESLDLQTGAVFWWWHRINVREKGTKNQERTFPGNNVSGSIATIHYLNNGA